MDEASQRAIRSPDMVQNSTPLLIFGLPLRASVQRLIQITPSTSPLIERRRFSQTKPYRSTLKNWAIKRWSASRPTRGGAGG